MRGGLRALVAATRSTTPRLRPRPVSRFEPIETASPETEFEPASEREQPVDTPTRRVEVTAKRASADTAGTYQPKAPVNTITAGADQPRPPVDTTTTSPQRDWARTPGSAASVDERTGDSLSTTAAPPPIALPPWVEAPIAPPPSVEAPRALRRPQVSSLPSPPVQPHLNGAAIQRDPLPERESARPDPPHRPAPMTERQLGALVPAPIPSVLATANVRPAEPPGRLSATPLVVPTNPPQPDVHVSIGRIEVRANEPSAAAPAHPHTTTPLGVIGLDDYLAQRGRP